MRKPVRNRDANLQTALTKIHRILKRHDVTGFVIVASGAEVAGAHLHFETACYAELVEGEGGGVRIEVLPDSSRQPLLAQLGAISGMAEWWTHERLLPLLGHLEREGESR